MSEPEIVGTIITACPECGIPCAYNAARHGRWACVRCEEEDGGCGEPFWIEVVSVGGLTWPHDAFMREVVKPKDAAVVEAIAAEVREHGHEGSDDDPDASESNPYPGEVPPYA